MIQCIFLPH